MPVTNDDNPHVPHTTEADRTAEHVREATARAANVDESAPAKKPKRGDLVATRTRRVQVGELTVDLVAGEPVAVPKGHDPEEWVAQGWVHHNS